MIEKNMNFSLEIGPKTDLETLPPVKDVYVTMLPGGDYKETSNKSIELVKKGFNPVPHFPARSIQNDSELKDYVSRCKDGGVKQALIIGGGREPLGKFDSSFQLLETGYFENLKILMPCLASLLYLFFCLCSGWRPIEGYIWALAKYIDETYGNSVAGFCEFFQSK